MMTLQHNQVTYTCPYFDVMPQPTPEELAELEADIAAHGITYPVLVSEDNEILDGHNRLRIAIKLGLTRVPMTVLPGLSPDQKRERAEDLNLHRRHLTREQQREIVARRLKADPTRSDRDIAAAVGADHKTVGTLRKALAATGEIPQLAATRGRDGKSRRAKPANTRGASDITPPPNELRARWATLDYLASMCESLAKELRRVKRTPVADRKVAPVRDVAARLRRLADDVEGVAAEGGPA